MNKSIKSCLITLMKHCSHTAGLGSARAGVAETSPRAASPCLSPAALLIQFPALHPDRNLRAAAALIHEDKKKKKKELKKNERN